MSDSGIVASTTDSKLNVVLPLSGKKLKATLLIRAAKKLMEASSGTKLTDTVRATLAGVKLNTSMNKPLTER